MTKGVTLNCNDNGILTLEFANMQTMTSWLEPVSTFVEGKTTTCRIGHNFSIVEYNNYIQHVNKNGIEPINTMLKRHTNIKYIIGYVRGDVKTKKHELCHALFYVDKGYNEKMMNLWESLAPLTKRRIEDFLNRLGYPHNKHIDEFQAYYNTEKGNFFGFCVV